MHDQPIAARVRRPPDRDSRSTKEDAHRAAGTAGDVLVYELPDTVQGFRVSAFFQKAGHDLKFSISDDGQNFHAIAAQKEIYFHGTGEYDYWKPVLFHAENLRGGNFLKNIFPAQLLGFKF